MASVSTNFGFSYSSGFELDIRENRTDCIRVKNSLKIVDETNDQPRQIFGETTPVHHRISRTQEHMLQAEIRRVRVGSE